MAVSKSNLSAIAKQNLEKTIESYKHAIRNGDIHVTPKLFEIYAQNGMSNEVAVLSQATYNLAWYFIKKKDIEKGIALFEYTSSLCGDFKSMLILFDHYVLSRLQKDNPKFLKLRDNMYKLAEQYQAIAEINTDPVIKFEFYDKAIELYDRTRKLGSVDAIYKLAQCYEHSSMPQYDTALELYELASMRDHLGALYRLSEICLENIEHVPSINYVALATKLYESAQFYQNLKGLENREHAKKLYELAAHFGHVEARDQLFNSNFKDKTSLSLADTKQENPLSKVEVRTEKEKCVNSKPVYTDKTSQEKGNRLPNATAINRLGIFPNANKSNCTIPHIPTDITIYQPRY